LIVHLSKDEEGRGDYDLIYTSVVSNHNKIKNGYTGYSGSGLWYFSLVVNKEGQVRLGKNRFLCGILSTQTIYPENSPGKGILTFNGRKTIYTSLMHSGFLSYKIK
jgi:hypothetical protein